MVEQRLNLSQSQSLVMTPQLQQAIKLLQLSHLELAEFLEQEIEQNPLLEKADGGSDDAYGENDTEAPAPDQRLDDTDDFEDSNFGDTPSDGHDAAEYLESDTSPLGDGDQPLDLSPEDYYSGEDVMSLDGSATDWQANSTKTDFSQDERSFEESTSEDVTLAEHLSEQANLCFEDPKERLIATYLINCLDETGYLAESPQDISGFLKCTPQEIVEVLKVLQTLEPAGCFARNLEECIALQLKNLDRYDPAMAKLVQNLEMLAAGKFDELCKLCGVDNEDLADMIGEIKMLNPKPGDAFRSFNVETLIPDVVMKARKDNNWHVELNPQALPKVLVNNRYYATVSKQAKAREDKKYLTECYHNATWLAKALDQRAQSILKVATAIVEAQDGFFRHGLSHLKPMTLKDIAGLVDVHESTVSRVTTSKYISTPRGVFELKYFFSSALGSGKPSGKPFSGGAAPSSSAEAGDGHSSEYVRQTIRALIDAEPAEKPLSDDKLVKFLKEKDIDVARRTVAKYREQLGIGSSTQRRRDKKYQSFMEQQAS